MILGLAALLAHPVFLGHIVILICHRCMLARAEMCQPLFQGIDRGALSAPTLQRGPGVVAHLIYLVL